jgi:hypothetical protein
LERRQRRAATATDGNPPTEFAKFLSGVVAGAALEIDEHRIEGAAKSAMILIEENGSRPPSWRFRQRGQSLHGDHVKAGLTAEILPGTDLGAMCAE